VIQLLGWIGSALVVTSLTLRRPVPFRLMNLASAVVLLIFNVAIGLIAMVLLNIVILIVNVWQLQRLLPMPPRQRPQARTAAIPAAPAKASGVSPGHDVPLLVEQAARRELSRRPG
jgi:hypothetical protein